MFAATNRDFLTKRNLPEFSEHLCPAFFAEKSHQMFCSFNWRSVRPLTILDGLRRFELDGEEVIRIDLVGSRTGWDGKTYGKRMKKMKTIGSRSKKINKDEQKDELNSLELMIFEFMIVHMSHTDHDKSCRNTEFIQQNNMILCG